MRRAIYNSGIPDIVLNTVHRVSSSALFLRLLRFFLMALVLSMIAVAADWSGPEQQLARKIVAVTGPGAVALSVENRSALGTRDQEIVQNGLRAALEAAGLRFVKPEQSAATVSISLSENASSYVWVALVHVGSDAGSIVMVTAPRPEGTGAARDSVPMTLRKIPLFSDNNPILDVVVLEEASAPTRIVVLQAEKISLQKMQNGKWQQEQAAEIAHSRPWPRDLRGRLIPRSDHLFDVYLPGVFCRSGTGFNLTLSCHDSDDPWPLVAGTLSGGTLSAFPSASLSSGATTVLPQLGSFYAATRNFFTGALTPGVGKFTTVPKFYAAAVLPREKYSLWLFAATDGQVHMVDGVSDQSSRLPWGSDLASVKTACGAGWQVLATTPGENGDAVRAYEFPDRDPVAVSAALELNGQVTAIWAEGRGDSAVVVVNNRDAGSYDAFRVAMACGQ